MLLNILSYFYNAKNLFQYYNHSFFIYLGWLNNLAAFIQMASTIAISVTIIALAKIRASAYDVFVSTNNSTGFSFAYVCCIGILPTLFSFSGYESAGHLTEETRDADRKAPIAISGTCISAALIGFVYLLALLFASGNPTNLVENQFNPSATVQIYQTSTSYPVALIFTILLIICLYFSGVSATTVSSRTGYAMARDSLFPCSKYLTIIYKRTQTPLTSVLLVAILNILLLLLQLFSTTAFAAIISISTIGFQVSYMIPIVFRCTTARKTFKKGRFNLGKFGVPIGIINSVWLFVTSLILLFPFNYPITAENMNWTIVVCLGITIFAALYWIFGARRWFTGPPRIADAENNTVIE
jgi:amino acid transporter